MNRFDRVTSILLLLQTRRVVTAKFLADHFSVTERTIYRDIRSLENAGVPIGSEAGIGYFLEKGYRLPPVSYTLDEASALLLGEKLLVSGLDQNTLSDFRQALDKVRAVIDVADKDYLASLDANIEVLPTGSQFPVDLLYAYGAKLLHHPVENRLNTHSSVTPDTRLSRDEDRWLRECRTALVGQHVIDIQYLSAGADTVSTRQLEPIGLFYYGWHWHLIAWCRLKEDYRDFRLDRVMDIDILELRYQKRSRLTLKQYLQQKLEQENLEPVELLFDKNMIDFVAEQRYLFGYIDEEFTANGIKMLFMTPFPDYMARWLLQFVDNVTVLQGDSVRMALKEYTTRLAKHWTP